MKRDESDFAISEAIHFVLATLIAIDLEISLRVPAFRSRCYSYCPIGRHHVDCPKTYLNNGIVSIEETCFDPT